MEGGAEVLYNPYRNLLGGGGLVAFRTLFDAERHFMVEEAYAENRNLIRNEAVSFIAQSESESADAFIPHMAMTYFDRLISRHAIPEVLESSEENRTLFLICCLSLASKLRTNNFILSRFLHDRTCYFAAKDVLRMELQICRILNWRLRTLTPIFFAEYFIELLNLPPDYPSPRPSIHRLIIKSQEDITLTAYRPSNVAASAVLTVSTKMFPAQANEFNFRNYSSEVLNRKLALLCEGLSVKVVGEASSSGQRPDTQGTPSSAGRRPAEENLAAGEASRSRGTDPPPGAEQAGVEMTRRAGKEPAIGEAEMTHRAGKEPAIGEAEMTRRAGKEPAIGEAEMTRRAGKEPAVGGNEAEAEESEKDLVQALDEPLAFQQGWAANNDTDRNLGAERTLADVAAKLMRKLNDCMKSVSDCCTIL